jgi:hypothetical protein
LDKACAQLFNLTESVVLTVSLNYGEVQTKVFKEYDTGKNFFKCINFQVNTSLCLLYNINIEGA